jgi:3-oxoacyl-[acyl-carrier protein] reductase
VATGILAGKTAVVTGAAGTLGLAAVRGLLDDGAQVALVDIDAMRLDSLIRFVRGTTLAVPCDVTDAGAVRQACQQVEKVLGPVDILVNNANVVSTHKSATLPDDEWRATLAVNLDGALHWSRAVLPSMKSRGWGRIVSVGAFTTRGGAGTAYAVARGALEALTTALAREYAEFGITVNGIAAAFVTTPTMMEGLNDSQRRMLLAQVPAQRFCEPEELAHAVRFLAAPMAGFITGTTLDVDGGLHL